LDCDPIERKLIMDASPKNVVESLDVEQGVPEKKKIQSTERPDEDDEVAMLGDSNQEFWIRSARRVSYASIAFTLVGGVTGIILSFLTDSVSLLGYGLESFVDVWSSVLVLWRFWSTDANSSHKQTIFNQREQRASFGIAVTFILIGLFVAVQAIIHIANREREENAEALLAISTISAVFLAALAAIKFRISRELNSPSLYKDGMSSVAVSLLSFGILLSTVVYDLEPDVWWLDYAVALLISVFLIVYGSVAVYKHRKGIET